jgi:hypothetical protein
LSKPNFSLHNFKSWLAQKPDMFEFFDLGSKEPEDEFAGRQVIAKVSEEKIRERIDVQSGVVDSLVDDFLEDGGVIVSSADRTFLIEVASGTFNLPRFCLRVRKA